MIVGVFCLLLIRPAIGPRVKVLEQQPGQYDKLVELRNVHPAFVAAVNQMHAARAANSAAMAARPTPPSLP